MRALLAVLAVALAAAVGCGGDEAGRPPTLRLALDFQPNAVHAGIYEARAAGEDAELEIRTPSSSSDSLKLLLADRADLAVVDIHDLGLARERGADVVGVGALIDRPLAAVVARPGIDGPRELEGRRVGVTGLPSDRAVLRSTIRAAGGDPGAVRQTTIGFSAVPSLFAGQVDAVVTFWNAEGVALRRRGLATREFRVDDFGAPRYPELVLVARRETVRDDPERLRAGLRAIAAGQRAARSDPAGAAELVTRASGTDGGLVRAQLDALGPALSPTLALDRAVLQRWARFDARFGILERPADVEAAFDFGLAPRAP